jgi:hypothetical protein
MTLAMMLAELVGIARLGNAALQKRPGRQMVKGFTLLL